jgi:hypothetical protein
MTKCDLPRVASSSPLSFSGPPPRLSERTQVTEHGVEDAGGPADDSRRRATSSEDCAVGASRCERQEPSCPPSLAGDRPPVRPSGGARCDTNTLWAVGEVQSVRGEHPCHGLGGPSPVGQRSHYSPGGRRVPCRQGDSGSIAGTSPFRRVPMRVLRPGRRRSGPHPRVALPAFTRRSGAKLASALPAPAGNFTRTAETGKGPVLARRNVARPCPGGSRGSGFDDTDARVLDAGSITSRGLYERARTVGGSGDRCRSCPACGL